MPATTQASEAHTPDDCWRALAEANTRQIAVVTELLEALTGAAHALRSYQYGNASPDLAQSMADACDAAITKATGG